jgi:hypothetical protein
VLVAVASLFSWRVMNSGPDIAALVTAAGLVLLLALEVYLLTVQPQKDWFDGRVLAESVKTLSWRYTVGAQPFPVAAAAAADNGSGGAEPDDRVGPANSDAHERATRKAFTDELHRILLDMNPGPPPPNRQAAVPQRLATLRTASLDDRREVYLRDRIQDQLVWYKGKARFNRSWARRLRLLAILLEVGGIGMAGLRAFNVIHLDLASLAATAIAVIAAWTGVKQYDALERAYNLAAHDLTLVDDRLRNVDTEKDWALEVADAEESISREHTMWRASRSHTTL